MAFNIQTFKTRSLSAVVFVAIMLCGVLINQWTFFLLFSIIHLGCWVEYQKLIGVIDADYKDISSFHKWGVVMLGWSFMMWMTNDAYEIFPGLTLFEVGWWLMLILAISLPVVEVLLSKHFNLTNTGYSLFGLIYISLSWGLMVNLRAEGILRFGSLFSFDLGWVFPVILIASIWINDTMAYIVGSLIGKTPFSSISPKKTWEGTIGGAILAIAVVTLLGYFAFDMDDYISLIIISTLAAVIGTLGDLFESKLKRLANVKDSGAMMPGHGGFLDRFDSLVMATPFVWLYVKIFL
ncbi:MAG TPA: phosphatidate cytidylyltransferase [Panacibacter sp.]|nr:phosphatidate cytidylyltransferase [Panacibacter sp.]HNP43019.1 phosphatidate cytidylyltransferase [Panacibacter sp.]